MSNSKDCQILYWNTKDCQDSLCCGLLVQLTTSQIPIRAGWSTPETHVHLSGHQVAETVDISLRLSPASTHLEQDSPLLSLLPVARHLHPLWLVEVLGWHVIGIWGDPNYDGPAAWVLLLCLLVCNSWCYVVPRFG